MTERQKDQTERRRRSRLTRQAFLFGGLAIIALLICAINVLAIIGTIWEPMHLLMLPLYMMLAAASLWASVNFLQTRSRMLAARDAPEEGEDE